MSRLMNNRREDAMQISEHELAVMTSDLDQLHKDHWRELQDKITSFGEGLQEQMTRARRVTQLESSRRNFLRGGLVTAGAIGGGLIVTACGSSNTAGGTSASASPSADLTVARLAASLEVLAVSTYATALMGAQAGSFGAVPPAFGTFATTAKAQHTDHENAWNAALSGAGQRPQTAPDPKYAEVVNQALPGLKTIGDVAGLALTLENVALETYTAASSLVTSNANRLVALTIAPVEAQHVAILSFILGKYPVANSFVMTDMAASPSDLG